MLVLSRKLGERIVIGNGVTVTVVEVKGSRVKLGFDGPPEVAVHREEIHRDIHGASKEAVFAGRYALMAGCRVS
jgi:carbon storage regulator